MKRRRRGILGHDVMHAFHKARQDACKNIKFDEQPKCPDCHSRDILRDERMGSIVCSNCGRELDRIHVESFFGASGSQYSLEGSMDSYQLDKSLGLKAGNGWRTTVAYKSKLLKRAKDEIDTACVDERQAFIASEMFKSYSNSVETVRGFKDVVQVCVNRAETQVAAERGLLHQRAPVFKRFPCKKCLFEFNCARDLRFHVCKLGDCNSSKSQKTADCNSSNGTQEVQSPRCEDLVEMDKSKDPILAAAVSLKSSHTKGKMIRKKKNTKRKKARI